MTLANAVTLVIAWAVMLFIFKKQRESDEQSGTIINILIDLVGMAAAGALVLTIPNSEDVVGWMTGWAGEGARYIPLVGIAVLLAARSGKIPFLAKTGITIAISVLAGVVVASAPEWTDMLRSLTDLTSVVLVAGVRALAVIVEFIELLASFAQVDFNVPTETWDIKLGA